MTQLFQRQLHDLHQRGNHQNESDGLHKFQMQRDQQIIFDNVSEKRGDSHDESNGQSHAQRSFGLLGNAEERTDAQKLRHDKVVDQHTSHYDQKQVIHAISSFAFSLLCLAMASVRALTTSRSRPRKTNPPDEVWAKAIG